MTKLVFLCLDGRFLQARSHIKLDIHTYVHHDVRRIDVLIYCTYTRDKNF